MSKAISNAAPCGAKTKAGGCCRAPAMPNGRCRIHGGATPSGSASPNFKHGRWSKHLPLRLAAQYKIGINDPTLCRAHDEIALLDLRLAEELDRLDTGESGEAWNALAMAYQALKRIEREAEDAASDEEIEDFRRLREEAIDGIGHIIMAQLEQESLWREILSLIEVRRKLVDVETRRKATLLINVPVEDVTTMIAAFEASIHEHVHDPKTKTALIEDINRLAEGVNRAA